MQEALEFATRGKRQTDSRIISYQFAPPTAARLLKIFQTIDRLIAFSENRNFSTFFDFSAQ